MHWHTGTHTSTVHTYKHTTKFKKGVWELSAESEKWCNLIIIIWIIIAYQGLRGFFALLDTWLICEQIIAQHPWRLLFKLQCSVPHRIPKPEVGICEKAFLFTISFQNGVIHSPTEDLHNKKDPTPVSLTLHWQLISGLRNVRPTNRQVH